MTFIEKIESFIARYTLFNKDSRINVAFSAGPDSVALLAVLQALSSKHHYTLLAHHIRHGLRDDSPDLAVALEITQRLGVPLTVTALDLQSHADTHNVESTAREHRYKALYQEARVHQASVIALAHHANDNLETLLWRLARGCGLEGLTLRSKRPWPQQEGTGSLVRPLLCVGKQEILDFLHSQALPYATDPTNSQDLYLRNHIRHHITPSILELSHTLHPQAQNPESNLYQSLVQIQESNAAISGLIANFVSQGFCFNEAYYFERDKLKALGYPAFCEVMAHLTRRIIQGYVPSTDFRKRAWEILNSSKEAEEITDNHVSICMDRNATRWCTKKNTKTSPTLTPTPLLTQATWANLGTLTLQKLLPLTEPRSTPECFWWRAEEIHENIQILSASEFKTWITPEGHTHKMSEILGRLQIPRGIRASWPILCQGSHPLWVVTGPRSAFAPKPEAGQPAYQVHWQGSPQVFWQAKMRET